jgi:putative tryptophan/tyrosine transport system substrate-binding protein
MRRIGLAVVLAVSLALAPLAGEAQQAATGPRIGVLWATTGPDRKFEAFRAGLRELGYIEGENITVLHRFAEGREDRLPILAADLVRLSVDVIVVDGTRAIRAAKDKTKMIPIVMASAADPVQSGFVASLSRPGGNITGLANIIRELNRKRLELLKDLVPRASRVVVLYSKGTYDDAALDEVREAALALRIEPQFVGVRGPEVLEGGFRLSDEPRGSALLVLSDAVLSDHQRRVVDLAAKSRLPAIYTTSGWVRAGGLMSYGADLPDLVRRAAYFVDKIVKGTSTLNSILDDAWFAGIEHEIRNSSPPNTATADPSGFLYDFCHSLRGVDWFEEAQSLALKGQQEHLDQDARFALWFAGMDPLRTVLPRLDSRLTAFAAIGCKPAKVQTKLAELRAAKTIASFKNHLFELSVLGDLALKGVLVDIEDTPTGVDGTCNISGRDILVEATNTVQQVIPDFVGAFFTDPNREIDQVIKKLRKKVAEGRQLAKAAGRPTLLFLARTHLGAGREEAHIALRECFAAPEFAALSGVVMSDSWKLYVTSWHPGASPDIPLADTESQTLAKWYGRD